MDLQLLTIRVWYAPRRARQLRFFPVWCQSKLLESTGNSNKHEYREETMGLSERAQRIGAAKELNFVGLN